MHSAQMSLVASTTGNSPIEYLYTFRPCHENRLIKMIKILYTFSWNTFENKISKKMCIDCTTHAYMYVRVRAYLLSRSSWYWVVLVFLINADHLDLLWKEATEEGDFMLEAANSLVLILLSNSNDFSLWPPKCTRNKKAQHVKTKR